MERKEELRKGRERLRTYGWNGKREREREISFLAKVPRVFHVRDVERALRNTDSRQNTRRNETWVRISSGLHVSPASFRDNSRDTIIRMKIERANNTLRQAESIIRVTVAERKIIKYAACIKFRESKICTEIREIILSRSFLLPIFLEI